MTAVAEWMAGPAACCEFEPLQLTTTLWAGRLGTAHPSAQEELGVGQINPSMIIYAKKSKGSQLL